MLFSTFLPRLSGFSALLLAAAMAQTAMAQAAPNASLLTDPPAPLFSSAARAQLITYWNAPGRYEVGPRPGARTEGAYVVRLTPDASRWFNAFNRYLKPGGIAPTKNAVEITDASRPWETWVLAKLKYDRARAAQQAAFANVQLFATAIAPEIPVDATAPIAPLTTAPIATTPAALEAMPPHPGPIPTDLLAAIGNAPPFAVMAMPRRHTVRFESGEIISYTDHIAPGNPRNAYLRFSEGVASGGTALSTIAPADLDRIFAASNLTPTESRVMRAISLLEGGFDSINTYDTGFVSVGFIQFAALEGGGGSLGDVLKREKQQNPLDYARDFPALGVDVTPGGLLSVVDPSSGAELVGNAAALKIIEDKRLTAVFHLAGQRSTAFRAAQIQVAKTNYYPADDKVSVIIGDQTLTARVGDVIKSEAGLATLFDRKVNTGNIRALNAALQKLMLEKGLTSLEQTLPFERETIAAVRWRSDFLKDKTLTQPQ